MPPGIAEEAELQPKSMLSWSAEKPASKPITPVDMMSTILHTVFDAGKMRLDPTVPLQTGKLVLDREPIQELF